MGFGIFFIFSIMLVFVVTHLLKFGHDTSAAELACELSLLLLAGITCYAVIFVLVRVI